MHWTAAFGNDGVFFAGEKFSCTFTLENQVAVVDRAVPSSAITDGEWPVSAGPPPSPRAAMPFSIPPTLLNRHQPPAQRPPLMPRVPTAPYPQANTTATATTFTTNMQPLTVSTSHPVAPAAGSMEEIPLSPGRKPPRFTTLRDSAIQSVLSPIEPKSPLHGFIHTVQDDRPSENTSARDTVPVATMAPVADSTRQATHAHSQHGSDIHNGNVDEVKVKASIIKDRLNPPASDPAQAGLLAWLWPFSSAENQASKENLVDENAPMDLETIPLQAVATNSANTAHATVKPDTRSFKQPQGPVATTGNDSSNMATDLENTASHVVAGTRARQQSEHQVISIEPKMKKAASAMELGSRRPSIAIDASMFMRHQDSEVDSVTSVRPLGLEPSKIGMHDNSSPIHKQEVALAFVQLVGYYTLDPSLVKTSAEADDLRMLLNPPSGAGLPVAELYSKLREGNAIPIFMTPPCILFGGVQLAAGQKKSFWFECILPQCLPPTHRGRTLQITYKLVLGVQRNISVKAELFQLPFRIFDHVDADGTRPEFSLILPTLLSKEETVVLEELDLARLAKPSKSTDTSTDVLDLIRRQSSGYGPLPRRTQRKQVSLVDNARGKTLERIMSIFQRTKRVTFDICKNNRHITQFRLTRSVYRLGEVISATFDFSRNEVPCYQLSVFLESKEIIEPGHLSRPLTAELLEQFTRKTHAEHHEYCFHTRRVNVSLCIPNNASPEFLTNMVSVTWQLRLEFITSAERAPPPTISPANVAPVKQLRIRLKTEGEKKADAGMDDGEPSKVNVVISSSRQSLLSHSPASPSSETVTQAIVHHQARDRVHVDSFSCVIPLKVYPTDWDSGRLYPGIHRFTT